MFSVLFLAWERRVVVKNFIFSKLFFFSQACEEKNGIFPQMGGGSIIFSIFSVRLSLLAYNECGEVGCPALVFRPSAGPCGSPFGGCVVELSLLDLLFNTQTQTSGFKPTCYMLRPTLLGCSLSQPFVSLCLFLSCLSLSVCCPSSSVYVIL